MLTCGEQAKPGEPDAPQDSAAFLRGVLETTPECIKIVDRDGRLLQMNDAGLAMIGAPSFESVRQGEVFALIAPEDRPRWIALHERVCAGESLVWTFDVIGLNGVRRPMETHAVPFQMPDGETAQLAVTRDISARRAAEAQQQLLINELNHRVKNTLAIVQAVARLSLRDARSPEALADFEDRLVAMAAAHDVITARCWTEVPVRQLVETALGPFAGGSAAQVGGPEVFVPAEHAVALGMVLHELATNAAKHGALAAPGGQLAVRWRPGRDVCEVEWREQVAERLVAPATEGFGLRLIRRAFGGQAVDLRFESTGMTCRIRAPLHRSP